MSLRWRIVVFVASAVALAVVGAGIGSYLAVRSQLLGQIDETLSVQSKAISEFGGAEPPKRTLPRLPNPPQATPTNSGSARVQRINPSGSVAQLPRSTDPLPITTAQQEIAAAGKGTLTSEQVVDGEEFRQVTVGIGESGAIVLSRSLEGANQVLARLRVFLILLGGAGIAAGAALGLGVARRILAPVKDLTETAEHIGETSDLRRRIEISGDDEVARLAGRFNAMLDALETDRIALSNSVRSQRQLVADASHELRTPVAAIRTDIEAALAHPELSTEERDRILRSADDGIEEVSALINDLIELARGDTGTEDAEDVRLDQIVLESVERFKRLNPGREVRISMVPATVRARPDRLYRAINNLLDNADKYSPAGKPVDVNVTETAVDVTDHGPGIPEEDLDRLFDRFWRGSNSRQRSGSGLGLAIVRQVAEANNASVTATNLDRGGASFLLSFEAYDESTVGPEHPATDESMISIGSVAPDRRGQQLPDQPRT